MSLPVILAMPCGELAGIPVPSTLVGAVYTVTANTDYGQFITAFDLNPWHATLARILVGISIEIRWTDYATPFLDDQENLLFEISDGVTMGSYYWEYKKLKPLEYDLAHRMYSRGVIRPLESIFIAGAGRIRFRIWNYTYERITAIGGHYYHIPL